MPSRSRRALLSSIAAGLGVLGGCTDAPSTGTSTERRSPTPTPTPTATPTDTPTSTPTASPTPTDAPTATPAGLPDGTPSPTEVRRPADAVSWTFSTGYDVQYPVAAAGDTVYVPSDALYALSTGGRERWRSAGGPTEATPVVHPEGVFTLLSADVDAGRGILAVDRAGDELWRHLPDEGVNYLAAGPDNVYASSYGHLGSSGNRTLHAVDATTGERAWRAEVGYPTDTVVVDGTVVNVSPGVVRAFDAADGTRLWRESTPDGGYESIAGVHDGAVVLRGGHAVSVAGGRTRWLHDGGEALLVDGRVFLAVERREGVWQLAALDATTGREQWRSRTLTEYVAPLAHHDGTLVAGSGIDDGIVAFSTVDGAVEWAWTGPKNVWAADAVGGAFLLTFDRDVFVVDAGGTEWWSYRSAESFSGIVPAGTTAVLGDRRGTVHALSPG